MATEDATPSIDIVLSARGWQLGVTKQIFIVAAVVHLQSSSESPVILSSSTWYNKGEGATTAR